MNKKIGITFLQDNPKMVDSRLGITFTDKEHAEMSKIDESLQAIMDDVEFGEDENGELTGYSDQQAQELFELTQQRGKILDQVVKRVESRYEGNLTAFYKDIKEQAVEIAKGYKNFPWEMAIDRPSLGTPDEIVRRGILSYTRVYLDYIEKQDPAAFNELITFIDEIAFKYSKPVLPQITTIFPDTAYSQIDRINRMIFENKIDEKETAIKIEGKGQTQITTYAKISYEGLDEATAALTADDKSVYNAIVTLYEAGQNIVTNQMIYRVIRGKSNARLNSKKALAINNSIRKMASRYVYLDVSEEINPGKYNHPYKDYEGNMLSVEGITADINGTEVSCYSIAPGVVYKYAKAKNQITSCPIELLNLPLNMTDEVIGIRDYLLEWILALKNPKSAQKNNELTYEKIYSLAYMNVKNTKYKKGVIRDQICQILNYWKKCNFIKDYQEIKKGRTIHKIRVYLEAEQRAITKK